MNTKEFDQISASATKAYMAWDELRKAQIAELEKAEQDAEKGQAKQAKAAGNALKKAKEAIKELDQITWQDWCESEGIPKSTADRLIRELDPEVRKARQEKQAAAMRAARAQSYKPHAALCEPSAQGNGQAARGRQMVRIDDLTEDKQILIRQLTDGQVTDEDASIWRRAWDDGEVYKAIFDQLAAMLPENKPAKNGADNVAELRSEESKGKAQAAPAKSQPVSEEAVAAA